MTTLIHNRNGITNSLKPKSVDIIFSIQNNIYENKPF